MSLLYFDHAATSYPKADGVSKALEAFLHDECFNIQRGSYAVSQKTALTVLETREMLCRLFSYSGSPKNTVFVRGVTEGINLILKGYLQSGDHVLVSDMEHNAVMRPLVSLGKHGISFERIPADEQGVADVNAMLPLIRDNTKLVVINHASNVCGTIAPIERIAEICYMRNLPLVLDAAQTAGHIPIDFDGWHLSALCVSGHKGLCAPQGIGAVLFHEAFAKRVQPLIEGGTGSASDSEKQPEYMPDKFEAGTLNLPGIIGLHAALKTVSNEKIKDIREREIMMTQRLIDGIKNANVRILGTADAIRQVGVVSVDFSPVDNALVCDQLEHEFGILTRCGLHCAPNAHKAIGTFPNGTVRFSIGRSTSVEQIDEVIRAIRIIAEDCI